jgi:hypothetical protein
VVLRDWFEFLGGRPGEVIYVDGGSPPRTMRRLVGMVQEGLIDRLEVIAPNHWENSFDRCYIQEYRAGMHAQLPYIMFVKLDMLPFRRGMEGWLGEDLALLRDPRNFAVTTTHLIDPPLGEMEAGGTRYSRFDFASLNFALMTRAAFERSLREQIGEFIEDNFRGGYPEHLQPDARWRRALLEWAWQAHCRQHGLRTLARRESRDWTIFHINKRGQKLLEYRRRYRAREGVEAYFDKSKGLYRPPLKGWQRVGRGVEGVIRLAKGSRGVSGRESAKGET